MNPQLPEERQTDFSESSRAWTSLVFALLVLGMAALFYFGGEDSVFRYTAIIPALVGLLLLYGFVHSLLASKTPATTIFIQPGSVLRGSDTPLTIRQQGPVRLESLRVNLICEKSVRKGKARELTYPHQIPIFDSGHCEVALHDFSDFKTLIAIPAQAEPSREDASIRIVWRLEIWGKVIGRADFLRPFGLVVE